MAYIVKPIIREAFWEEPCMYCFSQIQYDETDIIHGFVDEYTAAQDYIVCPNCGNRMKINRCNMKLL